MFEEQGILQFGDRRLRARCRPVLPDRPARERIEATLAQTFAALLQTGQFKRHIGLAACQIGVLERAVLVSFDLRSALVMFNPVLEWSGAEVTLASEGCLSLWWLRGEVPRARDVEVSYENVEGAVRRTRFAGERARIVQHEIDHLDGILFIDRMRWTDPLVSRNVQQTRTATSEQRLPLAAYPTGACMQQS